MCPRQTGSRKILPPFIWTSLSLSTWSQARSRGPTLCPRCRPEFQVDSAVAGLWRQSWSPQMSHIFFKKERKKRSNQKTASAESHQIYGGSIPWINPVDQSIRPINRVDFVFSYLKSLPFAVRMGPLSHGGKTGCLLRPAHSNVAPGRKGWSRCRRDLPSQALNWVWEGLLQGSGVRPIQQAIGWEADGAGVTGATGSGSLLAVCPALEGGTEVEQ